MSRTKYIEDYYLFRFVGIYIRDKLPREFIQLL